MSGQVTLSKLTRIGVVGAGQLALMMGEASHGAGVSICVLAERADDPAIFACDDAVVGSPRVESDLRALAERVEIITFDHELVDLDLLERLERDGVVFRPSANSLRFSVDKAYQREALVEAGVPVPRFVVVDSNTSPLLTSFLHSLSCEPVIKSPRGGYDGRGVYFPRERSETLQVIGELSITGKVLVEERLELRCELAQQVARTSDGSMTLYPLVTTVQEEGMCVEVRFSSEIGEDVLASAQHLTTRLGELVQPVGVMAVEYFLTDDGLVVNELALRPHNSAHWTIEGVRTSQFTQHLLAVSGQSLGPVTPRCASAVMVNVVGAEQAGSSDDAASVEGVFVHDYGKDFRPGRKLGHVTALGDDLSDARVRAWKSARLYGTAAKES